MTKLVMFDLDGTLGNTLPFTANAFSKALAPYAGRALTYKDVAAYFGLDEAGMAKAIVPNNWQNAVRDYYKIYEETHDAECSAPFDGIKDLLEFLDARGAKVALITGKSAPSMMVTLKKFGLEKMFCDKLTGSPDRNIKADCIASVVEKYGFDKSECFYVGDTVSDVHESQKAGVACLSAAWGETADKAALEKENASNVFERVGDLRKFFESVC